MQPLTLSVYILILNLGWLGSAMCHCVKTMDLCSRRAFYKRRLVWHAIGILHKLRLNMRHNEFWRQNLIKDNISIINRAPTTKRYTTNRSASIYNIITIIMADICTNIIIIRKFVVRSWLNFPNTNYYHHHYQAE